MLLPYALDVRRPTRVRNLVHERGLPAAVVELAWYLLPYGSVRMRCLASTAAADPEPPAAS